MGLIVFYFQSSLKDRNKNQDAETGWIVDERNRYN